MNARRRRMRGSENAEIARLANSAQMIPVLGRLGRCEVAVSDGDGDDGALTLAVDEVKGLAVAWALEHAGDDGNGGTVVGTVAVDMMMVQGMCGWVVMVRSESVGLLVSMVVSR